MIVAETVLLAVLFYAWVGYPALLTLLACRGRRAGPSPVAAAQKPRLAVLLSAFNEEAVILRRLENLVETIAEYESDLSDKSDKSDGRRAGPAGNSAWLGVDGATDGTLRIAREFAASHPLVRVVEFKERRGKAAVLKDLVKLCVDRFEGPDKPDLLVFTDANTIFRRGALDRLVSGFRDERVGCVCGRLHFAGAAVGGAEPVYWQWEAGQKEKESRLDSCLGANGAIYALRPDLFWRGMPANTIVEDFVLGMKARERGFRAIYESGAEAEEALPEPASEWGRRVRIGAGDFQALWLCRACLAPRYGKFAWMFWSHKALRWFTPHMALALLVPALVQSIGPGSEAGRAAGGVILGAYAFGLASALFGGSLRHCCRRAAAPFRLWAHFVAMQAALLAGFLRFCRGGLKGYWARTER